MNLPKKLTVSRLVMAPLLFVAYWITRWTGGRFAEVSVIAVLVLFVLIEATDLLDGIIARKRNLVTDLGKVMDPFADTFSRLTYVVGLTFSGIMPSWAFIVIMWREFSIVFVRMLMMGKGVAVPANIWGKSKAVLYAVSAVAGFLFIAWVHWSAGSAWLGTFATVLDLMFVLAALASVVSFSTFLKEIVHQCSLSDMTR